MTPKNYPFPFRGETTIEQVLADMRKPGSPVFWLAFCRATGKERGKMKIVARCRYGAPPMPGGIGHRLPIEGRKVALMTDTGALPCHNADTNEYFTPLISHIEGFNLKKVSHSENGK